MAAPDSYGTRAELVPGVSYHRLGALTERGIGDVSRLPVTLKILLENSVRNAAAPSVREGDVEAIASWDGAGTGADRERAFMPARVLLQDFTGVPAVVDLAAMRSAVARAGGDPMRIDPLVPVDLVVDH
ncbi:MAG: aconitase family protein, partial [Candidatus Dormiibacterota bacterium]